MPKKCMICDAKASFVVKGTHDFFCEECAKENFGDLSVLVAVEEKAAAIKDMVDEKIDGHEEIDPDKQFVE